MSSYFHSLTILSLAIAGNTYAQTANLVSQGALYPPTVEVNINGQSLFLTVDTGSSDTWVYTASTTCIDAVSGDVQPKAKCNFGDVYNGDFVPIEGVVFNQSYGTGQTIGGSFGYATVEVADIVLPHQQVAFVSRSSANAFPGASGILGMAPAGNIEGSWAGNDSINADFDPPNTVPYPTVFESMYNVTGQVEPFFNYAVLPGTAGGYISFGSQSPVSFNQTVVTTPLVSLDYFGVDAVNNYYPIEADGIVLNGRVMESSFVAVVDSGTLADRLPVELADAFNHA
jgi:hypothetical protein